MTESEQREFEKLDVAARAKWLLEKGVTAKLTINPETLEPAYRASAAGALLPGYYGSEDEAIGHSREWLNGISNPPF